MPSWDSNQSHTKLLLAIAYRTLQSVRLAWPACTGLLQSPIYCDKPAFDISKIYLHYTRIRTWNTWLSQPRFSQLNYIVTQHCSVVTPAASERSVPSPFCSWTKTPFIIDAGQVFLYLYCFTLSILSRNISSST